MKLYSTNDRNKLVTFREAVLKGISKDGGLFMPVSLPKMPDAFFERINILDMQDIAFAVSRTLLKEEIPDYDMFGIIRRAFTFTAPLVNLGKDKYVLELFHGPTLAFKDFGARFLAETLSYFNKDENKELVILVATSGDTGSAVANGFHNVPGVKVVLLYPSGKVSRIQEQQLTTLGGNVTALEILGNFDDCQRMVKQAFADNELTSKVRISSANSINIARLLPQSFYYHYAYSQVEDRDKDVVFSVPSGNFGNLTGGLFAKEMGLPVHKFIAAVNTNDIFPQYLKTGEFKPKASVQTISNAMDVGNPSNFARISSLFQGSVANVKDVIYSRSYTDDQTKNAINEVNNRYGYLIDPHGAVGYMALNDYLNENPGLYSSIVLETAHPAKFKDIVEKSSGTAVTVPKNLEQCLNKEKRSIVLPNEYEALKNILL
ncbi:MAG: threonine synthase [Bacteroidales bacterium]|nr:threonine synthase [Bacteroidales bacterium]